VISSFLLFVRVLFGDFGFSTVRSSFCSVNSSFLPFVWVLIGSLKFPPFVRAFDRILGVSYCSRGFQSVIRSFFCSIAFLVSESGACWRSGSFVVKLQVSVKVSTSESIGVLLWCCFWKFLGVWEFLTDILLD